MGKMENSQSKMESALASSWRGADRTLHRALPVYSKLHLNCPVRFTPYTPVVQILKDRPSHLLLLKNGTWQLAGKPHENLE